jgi:hypothetical protein
MIRHVFGIANNQAVIARSLGLHGDLAKRIVLLPPDPNECTRAAHTKVIAFKFWHRPVRVIARKIYPAEQ